MYTVGLDELISLILYIYIMTSFYAKKIIQKSLLKYTVGITPVDSETEIDKYNSVNSQEKSDDTSVKEIIFGSLLGDGKLELPPRGINARFGFTQAESQKSYFLSVLAQLSSITAGKYREHSYTDERTGKVYTSLNF